MKITKRQLRRILREFREFTHEEIVEYLETQAAEYALDTALTPPAVQELLMDDFMDDIGAYVELSPEYKDLINSLAGMPGTSSVLEITRRQLRRIVKEVIEGPDGVWYDDYGNRLQPDESAPWGTYAEQGDESYSDVIIMSPNGDSVLVNGQETYAQDVPSELLLASGFPLPAPVASKLVREIEQQFAAGYVELGIEYKNGQWGW